MVDCTSMDVIRKLLVLVCILSLPVLSVAVSAVYLFNVEKLLNLSLIAIISVHEKLLNTLYKSKSYLI